MRRESEILSKKYELEKIEAHMLRMNHYCEEKMNKIVETRSISSPFGKRYENLQHLAVKYFDLWWQMTRMIRVLNWVREMVEDLP